ncbi:MAG TPA: sigma-70 family RNA polymerase sigma factor [Paludibaculum sp.]|jgi:RNA polymerase sigma-70 factor (ECF subfamily)
MVRTAVRMLRDLEDAEDATQQAFTAAWQNLDKFRGDASFSTWLTRITMNEALSTLRRRKRAVVELEENVTESNEEAQPVFASNGGNPEEVLIRKEMSNLLRMSLGQVKPVYRQAMELRLVNDMSVEEIAGRLRMPLNAVKVHLFRGRQSMRTYLEERMPLRAA